jgi:hypothetical protein
MGFLSSVSKVFGGGKKPKIPRPEDMWKQIPGQATSLLDYYGKYVPKFLDLQGELGPQIQQQTFSDVGGFLSSMLGLTPTATAGVAEQLSQARAAEYGQMAQQAPLTRRFMEALSPEQAEMTRLAQEEAMRATRAAGNLTPQEARAAQQEARQAFGARGMLGSNASVAQEVLGRENVLAAKRAEAERARSTAYSAAGQFYTTPGLAALGTTPESYRLGQSALSAALTGGPATTGQFDYNMPIGLGQQRAGALDAYNQAKYQADMAKYQSGLAMAGKAIGALGMIAAPFTGGLSAGLGLTGLAGGAAGATGFSGLGLSAGMGLSSLFGGIPKATPV